MPSKSAFNNCFHENFKQSPNVGRYRKKCSLYICTKMQTKNYKANSTLSWSHLQFIRTKAVGRIRCRLPICHQHYQINTTVVIIIIIVIFHIMTKNNGIFYFLFSSFSHEGQKKLFLVFFCLLSCAEDNKTKNYFTHQPHFEYSLGWLLAQSEIPSCT
jgi:hypothetical protein